MDVLFMYTRDSKQWYSEATSSENWATFRVCTIATEELHYRINKYH